MSIGTGTKLDDIGTWAVYRDWRVSPFPGLIVIRVLDPMTLAEAGGDAETLRDQVRSRMEQVLMELRGRRAMTAAG